MSFTFGLLHGFGFASVLRDVGLPREQVLLALLGFNAGVEVGQLAIVAVVLPLFLLLEGRAGRFVLRAGSALVVAIGAFWLVDRALPEPELSPTAGARSTSPSWEEEDLDAVLREIHRSASDAIRGEDAGAAAQILAEAAEDAALTLEARSILHLKRAQLLRGAGVFSEAELLEAKVTDELSRRGGEVELGRIRLMSVHLAREGRIEQAVLLREVARRRAADAGLYAEVARDLLALGRLHERWGRARPEPFFARAEERAEAGGAVELRAMALREQGRLSALSGALGEASALLLRAVTLWEALGQPVEALADQLKLTELYERNREMEAALSALRRAAELADAHGNDETRAEVRARMGHVLVALADLDAAESAYREAQPMLFELEPTETLGDVWVGLANVARGRSDPIAEQECLSKGLEAYRQVGATEKAERVARRLAKERLPQEH